MTDAPRDDDAVFELRRYTLKPGMRETLISVFDTHLVETQEAAGMSVACQFRDLAAPDQFVWFRGFADHERRNRALPAFYGGPVWAEHGPAANENMLAWDDVLLLKPARPEAGFGAGRSKRPPAGTPDPGTGAGTVFLLTLHHLQPDTPDEHAASLAAAVAEAARVAGGDVLASLVTDRSENGFPRLPVREGECVAVTLVRPRDTDDQAALEAALRAFPAALAATQAGRAPELVRLVPTARSLLR
ncbi:NIPSNAP family protein [Bosea sp. (in: a-proteobacteria)]|uniref:NIPSNAP family protein n=1 Tax=Bosea sp. (in: a-proteobacteria) TaxID=1871050 RepID=UPI002FC836D7